MKYSSCLFPPGKDVSLDEAEELMLDLYCQRAKLENGMDILDLGCGWGSLCLYLAEVRAGARARLTDQRYPKSRVYALSNSATQKLHIDATAKEKGLKNIQVRTGDVKTYDFENAIRCAVLEAAHLTPQLRPRHVDRDVRAHEVRPRCTTGLTAQELRVAAGQGRVLAQAESRLVRRHRRARLHPHLCASLSALRLPGRRLDGRVRDRLPSPADPRSNFFSGGAS